MRFSAVLLAAGMGWLTPLSDPVAACTEGPATLGVTRIVEIDTTAGPLYGDMSKYVREDSFLGPKEVVLTFDDGPMPRITKSILDTLDAFCTKATFFSVGQMALAYPQFAKDVIARGHTLGAHTWSHPLNIPSRGFDKARDEIDRGFAAVALAAGQPIAPFFRFPGLGDSDPLLDHLQKQGIATFTVDVVSNDSFISSPERLAQRTIAQTETRNGGILLFHDIKASTAKALPTILSELKQRGYKVVHMRPKTPFFPVQGYEADLAPRLAKAEAQAAAAKEANAANEAKAAKAAQEKHALVPNALAPAAATSAPEAPAAAEAAPAPAPAPPAVTELAPAPRTRAIPAAKVAGPAKSKPDATVLAADHSSEEPKPRATRKSAGRKKAGVQQSEQKFPSLFGY